MVLKELLKLLMPEQEIKIYESPNCKTPDYKGEAGYTPWWFADMDIDKNADIAVDEDGYIEINVTE